MLVKLVVEDDEVLCNYSPFPAMYDASHKQRVKV